MFTTRDVGFACAEVRRSYRDRWPGFIRLSSAEQASSGATSDIDGSLNQSFGEFGADTRLSAYSGWIDGQLSVPEPATTRLLQLH
jgi:hypothetical protein